MIWIIGIQGGTGKTRSQGAQRLAVGAEAAPRGLHVRGGGRAAMRAAARLRRRMRLVGCGRSPGLRAATVTAAPSCLSLLCVWGLGKSQNR